MLNGKNIDEITELDLLNMISEGEFERKTLDFKLTLPGNSEGEKKEFLFDVSSFANTSGGMLIYGMYEQGGIASELKGLGAINADQEILRLESILASGIAPRITNVSFKPVQLSSGGVAILCDIPQSWIYPHMVVFQQASKFYARHSAGKYIMDVEQIRHSFLSSQIFLDRMKKFRMERVSQIQAGEAPVVLNGKGKIVFHLIPLSAFQETQNIDLRWLENNPISPIYSNQINHYRYNLDGLLLCSNVGDNIDTYVQVFRNGIVEGVNTWLLNFPEGKSKIPSPLLEKELIKFCEVALARLAQLNINPPVFAFLSLIDAKGYFISLGYGEPFRSRYFSREIDRNMVLLPEIQIDTLPNQDITSELQVMFDMLWNACGYSQCVHYDANGMWKPQSA